MLSGLSLEMQAGTKSGGQHERLVLYPNINGEQLKGFKERGNKVVQGKCG